MKKFNPDYAINVSVFYCGNKANWKKYWGKFKNDELNINMEDFNKHVHSFIFEDTLKSKDPKEILDLAYDDINKRYPNDENLINSGTIYALNNELYFCASDGWVNVTKKVLLWYKNQ